MVLPLTKLRFNKFQETYLSVNICNKTVFKHSASIWNACLITVGEKRETTRSELKKKNMRENQCG